MIAGKTKARRSARDRRWAGGVAAVFLVLACAPLGLDNFGIEGLRDVLLFATFAVSLDLFWGRTGILSFGHATFFGLGAYGMAIATVVLSLDPSYGSLAGLGLGVALAAAMALAIGYFIIYGGVREAYFTIITLALTLIGYNIAVGWSSVTGGDSGLIGVPPLSIAGLTLSTAIQQFYLAWGLLAAAIFGSWLILRGRYGLLLKAIQDNEVKAQTLGHNTSLILLVMFVASAVIGALAGAIYVTATGFVAPDMIGLILSTEVIMWVAVGGRGSLIGAALGAMLVWYLQQQISSISTSLWPLFLGCFFVLMVFLFPDGLPALGERITRQVRSRVPSLERKQ